ncbi:YgfZ/GcvT domain-containing protein [Candidatus Leptofilum sp.]|uniref:CAF17-like 4Fe-4S cluster assembly/insertion protein YgfZ n=1 Tax=Candidatus Leptofilum sp. TaxID=3241576 RepID=UPI003B5A2196
MTTSQIELNVYQAARETAVLTNRSDLGVLIFSGETRFDLINRMSTQKVLTMAKGEGTATILTTDIGRIIDRLLLYATNSKVYALTSENNSDNIARYLMRFVFFQDDFHIQDVSNDTVIFGVYGPQARQKVVAAGFPDEDLPLHHWRQVKFGNMTAYLHRTDPIHGDGYFVMGERKDKDALWQRLLDAGLTVADTAAFDYLRIEAGLPRFGRELTADYIPLEANLWGDVSFNKGCYIGQEIIARMESRGKLAKKLVQLTADEPLEAGSDLQANGKNAGTVTSAAVGPHGTVGLGYVKTSVLDSGSELSVGETAVKIIKEMTA